MDPHTVRPSLTPELVARFAAYYRHHRSWGALHIVLDDANLADADVQFCAESAREHGDDEGFGLASTLLALSRSQRHRLGRRAEIWAEAL